VNRMQISGTQISQAQVSRARPRRTQDLRRTIATLATILALTGQGLASPAQDLFNQAAYYIAFYYNGYSSADWNNFSQQFQPELTSACQSTGEKCPYTTAVPIIGKMIEALEDGHTYYLSAAARAESARERQGQGSNAPRVGIITTEIPDSSDRLITDVQADGPAGRAGIIRGDRVVSLNAQASSTYGTSLEFQKAIGSAIGSGKAVKLGIQRGKKSLELNLRGEILPPRLPSLRVLPGNIGLLRIPGFEVYGLVGQTVHDLVRRANKQNLRALIVDVRDNPGGIDIEFIAALSAFVPKPGYVLESRASTSSKVWNNSSVFLGDPNGNPVLRIQAVREPALWRGRTVVLTNANSYSGAEYFAQGIQDAKRGTVIGEISGGLGNTVTTEYELTDGGAVSITFGKSLRLDGTPLPEAVTPDIDVTDDLEVLAATGRDLVLERALEEINAR
jgi:carboxyl-terminal processing protease